MNNKYCLITMFIIIVTKKDPYSIHWYLEAEEKK